MSRPGPAILLAVGGGIAAYKSAFLCSRLAQGGFDVRVVMTSSASHFIGAATFAALSGNPVAQSGGTGNLPSQSSQPNSGGGVFDPQHYPLGAHIELTKHADLMIVAPCTANLMAKFAHGIADDLVSTAYLQVACPVLCAPAMSATMWDQPAVQRNLAQLQADGIHFVGPDSGWLSCRVKGEGRMSEPDAILASATELIEQSSK